MLMLTIVVSDTAQYYTGRAFGRRPLAPAISPKKTIEGAVGGFVFGGLVHDDRRHVVAAVGCLSRSGLRRRGRRRHSASSAICSNRC